MAPIISFTAEEIWSYIDKSPDASVFLTDFPQTRAEYFQPQLAQDMENIIFVRDKVNKALEEARQAKLIGSGLEAELTLAAPATEYALLKKYEDLLLEIFIISRLKLVETDSDLSAAVAVNQDPKCPRCWMRHPAVPSDQSGVCPKCQKALAERE
jgi:isoleucyl-tRNA synthetase